jgi:hypothetical protein
MTVDLVSLWEYALAFCRGHGLTDDGLDWWRNLPTPDNVSDPDFFAELAWVIYNLGMRNALIRSKWPVLEYAYYGFDPVSVFVHRDEAIADAMKAIAHRGKAVAVADGAAKVLEDGPIGPRLFRMGEAEALEYLESFPFVGRVTRYHLARNCGFDVVKPDRHLVRLALALGYSGFDCPDALVREMSDLVGERKGMIDYVLWQWLSIEGSAGEALAGLPEAIEACRRSRQEADEAAET